MFPEDVARLRTAYTVLLGHGIEEGRACVQDAMTTLEFRAALAAAGTHNDGGEA